jgi:thioredoxin 1
MAQENPNLVVLKVDVDECEDIAAEYSISAMPTFIFIKNKTKVETMTGANAEKLKGLVASLQ